MSTGLTVYGSLRRFRSQEMSKTEKLTKLDIVF